MEVAFILFSLLLVYESICARIEKKIDRLASEMKRKEW